MVGLDTDLLMLLEENDALVSLTYERETSSEAHIYFQENYLHVETTSESVLIEEFIDLQVPLITIDRGYEEWNIHK
jgi:hypothetical protein